MTKAKTVSNIVLITRPDPAASILLVIGQTGIGLRAGTVIVSGGETYRFDEDTPIGLPDLVPGCDYVIGFRDGAPFASLPESANPIGDGFLAGFHFAPGACADGIFGGEDTEAINPFSLWDIGFRPACQDPRGMALVAMDGGKRFWADIYLLGVDHHGHGTSRCGATIADGRDLPDSPDGKGKAAKLDYATATAIYANHGKRLLGAEEFFTAAYGVKERCSRTDEPSVTGSLDDDAARFISRRGLFDVTGTMWQWGTDGHPDDPRPSLFGGSWVDGSNAGSRFALLACWPGNSDESISARGACDHLQPE